MNRNLQKFTEKYEKDAGPFTVIKMFYNKSGYLFYEKPSINFKLG